MAKAAALLAISVQELRRLVAHLQSAHPPVICFRWAWPIWRRRHQATAKRRHSKKRMWKLQL
ncbi:MAG: hypothetical protein ACT4O2_12630 [Beijerinckiaceae bacterium]